MVDRELASHLVELIDEEAGRSTGKKYSFDHFCKEHNLYKSSDKFRNGEVFINCVFHEDDDPSLSFNEEKRVWHCLGCGAGGKYLDFIYRYEKEVLGNEITFYHYLERLLKEDAGLQEKLGAHSIFKNAGVSVDSLETIEKFTFKPGVFNPSNYLELAGIMLQKHCNRQEIMLMLLGMQHNIDVSLLYKQIFDNTAISDFSKKYDLTVENGGFV